MDYRVKYPRTLHLPWSKGIHKDDRIIETLSMFEGQQVVVTEKMDGENATLMKDYYHPRSLTYSYHPSREHMKRLQASIGHEVPEGWRICGENLYAKHSIFYPNLEDYFQVFSIWNEENICLGWGETEEWCGLLGLTPVPVLYKGIYNEDLIKNLYKSHREGRESEGYVLRLEERFEFSEFPLAVAKFVRERHVQTNKHWATQKVTPNELKEEE